MHLTTRGVGIGSRADDVLARFMTMLRASSSVIAWKLLNDRTCSSIMGAQS